MSTNQEIKIIFRKVQLFEHFPFFLLQGSITDDKSKATHHIYPSPSQQDEGMVEFCYVQIILKLNHLFSTKFHIQPVFVFVVALKNKKIDFCLLQKSGFVQS